MLTTTITGNAYDVALENFDAAANALELSSDIREMIKYPGTDPHRHRAGPHGRRPHPPI